MTENKNAVATPNRTLENMLKSVDVKQRFNDMLGKKAAGFMSSIISVTNQNNYLKMCEPMSIIASAAVAASLDLPINPSLGFAHIVPYRNSEGKQIAQFQMGWKGFVQLAMRSGQYKTINVSEVYADELKFWNPLTGEIEFTPQAGWKQRAEGNAKNVAGYFSFFRLLNGFEKCSYMTHVEMDAHGHKYSKSYQKGKGMWVDGFLDMAKKTVLKLLLSKFGILSIEMAKAIEADQAVIDEDGTLHYPDGRVVDEPKGPKLPLSKAEAAKLQAEKDKEGIDPAAVDTGTDEIKFGEEK